MTVTKKLLLQEKGLKWEDLGKPGIAQFSCDICKTNSKEQKSFENHSSGKMHLKRTEEARRIPRISQFACEICKTNCNDSLVYIGQCCFS